MDEAVLQLKTLAHIEVRKGGGGIVTVLLFEAVPANCAADKACRSASFETPQREFKSA